MPLVALLPDSAGLSIGACVDREMRNEKQDVTRLKYSMEDPEILVEIVSRAARLALGAGTIA